MWSETVRSASRRSRPAAARSRRSAAIARALRRSPDWLSTKLTVLRPSAKSWLTTARKTSRPVAVSSAEGEADPEPVGEAVQGEPERAQRADAVVGTGIDRVVAVVQDQRPLERGRRRGSRPRPAAPRREGRRRSSIRLRQDARSRATATTMPPLRATTVGSVCEQAQRDRSAEQDCDHGQAGERDGDEGHRSAVSSGPAPGSAGSGRAGRRRGWRPRTRSRPADRLDRPLQRPVAKGASRPHWRQTR